MNSQPQYDTTTRTVEGIPSQVPSTEPPPLSVALLTGGSDRPYVHGLTAALSSLGVQMDLIGGDELDEPELRNRPGLTFLNLRGDQRREAGLKAKVFRVLAYYVNLMYYAATARPSVFHILWNNKFETFDRTLLILYYKMLGKKVVFTAHNVNAGKRDDQDTFLNRLTLRIQYRLVHHIFVHTEKMKVELVEGFGVREDRVSVIPFGINNSVPNTDLTPSAAKARLGIRPADKAILFFGRITPYKGLEFLVSGFQKALSKDPEYRLIIAGKIEKGSESYWETIRSLIAEQVESGRIIVNAEFVPDAETEIYFKAADVFVLPYSNIFQSGVLFLGYGFGLPALVANVGSLGDEIVGGINGFVFDRTEPENLAQAIERYFSSDLYRDLVFRRQEIRDTANARHSWQTVGQIIQGVYKSTLGPLTQPDFLNCASPTTSKHVKVTSSRTQGHS